MNFFARIGQAWSGIQASQRDHTLMKSLMLHYAADGPAKPRRTLHAKRLSPVPGFLLLPCLILSCTLVLRAAQDAAPKPLELTYTARVERPTTHLLGVEIVARPVESASLDFVLPAWGPGRYAIYDFAKNVQEFSAEDADHHPLPWSKLDKQTWRVEAGAVGGTLHVHYQMFIDDLTGSFSQVDYVHANLNGPSVFMYVEGHIPDPVTLSIEAPAGWKVYSGFSTSSAERTFHAPNYDRMVDTPLEICGECTLDQFEEQGKIIQVLVHTYNDDDSDRSRLLAGLRKLVHLEMAAMPPPDFDHYLFIFHFVPDLATGDGMEHLNSTQIITTGSVGDSTDHALETAAHEFFHLWNVKRLRPAALGPFDYTHENYSRSLWFAEGITSYYADVFLLQSGVWTREQFLGHLGGEISSLEKEPGKKLMSAESSSFNAWFFDRSPQMQETNFTNTTISYYNKGELLGMLMDLEIRARTQGSKSLLDVMRLMYHQFYDAPATSYYGPGRGYEEKDVLEALNSVTGSDFAPFFERYVRGVDPLPYSETLAKAGLQVRAQKPPDALPFLGAAVQPELRGARVVSIVPGSPADRAGLSRDDLLIDIDAQTLATEELATRLKAYAGGSSILLNVERHGRRDQITVTLDPPPRSEYSIVPMSSAAPDQVALREAWLASH
jgi:predicted metalloprotease with PDZ domain